MNKRTHAIFVRYIDDNNLSLLPHKCVFHGFTNQNFSGEKFKSENFVCMLIFVWVERSCSGFCCPMVRNTSPIWPHWAPWWSIVSILAPCWTQIVPCISDLKKKLFQTIWNSSPIFGTTLTLDSALCNYFRLYVMLARSLPNFGNKSEHGF